MQSFLLFDTTPFVNPKPLCCVDVFMKLFTRLEPASLPLESVPLVDALENIERVVGESNRPPGRVDDTAMTLPVRKVDKTPPLAARCEVRDPC